MIQNQTTPRQKAVLAAVDTGAFDAEISIKELKSLADTAGADTLAYVIQPLKTPDNAAYFGTGKLAEMKELLHNLSADLLIVDDELTGVQLRNIENAVETPVVDRTMLILDIFAAHAQTKEGKLQVELAQQKYILPRLVGMGQALSRQGGGIGTRGPGETKLETDRRYLHSRIHHLSEALKEVKRHRELTRARRKKNRVPVVAIVGYTNAGKSTLLNTLTGAGVLAENKLFATLDPTARELTLPNGRTVVLIDTVGLISRLPHDLVEAFHSTLEEAKSADIILEVCDASDPQVRQQNAVTAQVLADLGCGDTPTILVCNKADKLPEVPAHLPDNTVYLCAKTGEGVDRMLDLLTQILDQSTVKSELELPYTRMELLNFLHANGKVVEEKYTETGLKVAFELDNADYGVLMHMLEE